MRARPLAGAAVLAALCACAKDNEQPPRSGTPSDTAAPAAPAPVKFALADFGKLRWLEGAWRGTMPNGTPFHETYHFIDDSTIAMGGHTDSTLKTKSDSARWVFRAGEVIDSGGSVVYHASRIDSTGIDFHADPDPSHHFTFTRDDSDAWTARIFSKGPDGAERVTVYPMRRIRR